MEVSSASLAQAVAAARVALAEAFVLKVGQTLQAVVAGKAENGLTLLKIGDQLVKAALPEAIPPGTTLQLQVKSGGAAPQLVIVAQTPPQGRSAAPAALVETRPASPVLPSPTAEVAPRGQTVTPNGESPPVLRPASSPVESSAVVAAPRTASVPAAPAGPVQTASPGTPPIALGTAPVSHDPAPQVARVAQGQPVQAAAAPPPVPPATPGPAASLLPSASSPELVLREAALPPVAAPPAIPAVVAQRPATVVAAPPAATPVSVSPPPAATDTGPASSPPSTSAPMPVGPAPVLPEAPHLAHPLLVAQSAPRSPVTVAELPKLATPLLTGPAVSTAPSSPPPATPQAALAQLLPEALARQDSPAPLLQSLAALVQKPSIFPEPVLRAALGVLAQRIVVTAGRVEAADLERAVQRSGLGLEATLAKGDAAAPADAKAGLLALRAALAKWLGEGPPAATARDTAPPPLRGLPLRAPAIEAPPLPDAPRDALRAVHSQADAAVSRLKLMQLASLPDTDPARPSQPALRLELPLLIGHELVMAQLQVSRDGTRREAERKRGWTMRFALNFSATGEVGAEVGLLGKGVNVALWAAEPETAEAMQEALPELGVALEAIGLKPGALRIRQGTPQPEKPASGRLVDSVS
jgi:hypothetical protein